MAVEMMTCCGALTRVYLDAGKRQHTPECKWVTTSQQSSEASCEQK